MLCTWFYLSNLFCAFNDLQSVGLNIDFKIKSTGEDPKHKIRRIFSYNYSKYKRPLCSFLEDLVMIYSVMLSSSITDRGRFPFTNQLCI